MNVEEAEIRDERAPAEKFKEKYKEFYTDIKTSVKRRLVKTFVKEFCNIEHALLILIKSRMLVRFS